MSSSERERVTAIEEARSRKSSRLLAAVEHDLGDVRGEPVSWLTSLDDAELLLDACERLSPEQWETLARSHGIRPPSELTVAATIDRARSAVRIKTSAPADPFAGLDG